MCGYRIDIDRPSGSTGGGDGRKQIVTLPGQRAAAVVVGQMATEILAIEQRIAAVDELIAEHLDQHPLAPIVGSLSGMGPLLIAELLVHTAGTTEYDSPAKLAAHAATGHGEMPAIGRPPASAH
ncbi:hypothetical protein AB0D81_31930 [Micromonospora chersina]